MVRKYQFADIASLIVLLLDLASLFILNGPKLYIIIGSVVVIGAAILIRRYYPVNIDSMIKRFDFNVAWMVMCYIYAELNNFESTSWIIPSVFACAAYLMLIIFMRSNSGAAKGKVAAVIIFIFVLAMAILISMSVGEVAGSAVVGVFDAIGKAFSWIGNTIDRFIQYLISLLPDVEANGGQIITGDPIKYEIPDGGEEVTTNPIVTGIALIIAAITIVYVLILLFKYFTRHGKAVAKKKEKLQVAKKTKTKLGLALDKLRRELAYQIKMRIYMTKDTPLAKYYRLVYSKRLSPEHKQKSETPREFIARVSDLDTSFITSVEESLYR